MNIFDFAIEMEKDGEKFYREMAAKTNNSGFKTIFNMLADDEVKHGEIVKQMKANKAVEMEETTVLASAKNIFQEMQDKKTDIVSKNEEVELYTEARNIEKKSIEFYESKIEEAETDAQKAMLKKIADEERRHYHLMDNFVELLLRPKQWIETGEFIHLEDY
jgi:rubrerythrin